jgi:hypothetical protein
VLPALASRFLVDANERQSDSGFVEDQQAIDSRKEDRVRIIMEALSAAPIRGAR